MEKSEDKKMIAEMKDFLKDKAKAAKSDDAKAEEQLPFESIDSYSTDPVGFSEMSLRMLNKVEFVFDLAVNENRFSSQYMKRCRQLEKGIKYLGSLCVTKYALQTKGQTFPELGQLSTEKLYCMTSHHYRKLDMAVTEYIFEHRDLPDKLFDMEMRYFNLLERLRSTEVKIKKFNDKYIIGETDDTPVVHGLAFSEKSRTRYIHKKHDEAPAFRHAPAFGLLAEAEGLNKKSEIRNKSEEKCPVISGQVAVNEDGRMKKDERIGVQGAEIENAVPRDQFPPAHEMCPGELIPVAPSAVSAPVPEHKNGTCDSPLPANEEETTDEKGSVISGQVAVNEDGRMKKEERIGEQGERIENAEGGVRSRTCEGSDSEADCGKISDEDGRMKKEEKIKEQRTGSMVPEELPPCLEIMQRVMERSRETDDDSLTFTIEEMEFLAKDPVFNHLDPRLAADIRKFLEAGPPG